MLIRTILAAACALALALPAVSDAQPTDTRPADRHAAVAPPAPLATLPPPPTDPSDAGTDGWRVATIAESALLVASLVVAAAGAQLLRRQSAARSMPYTAWSI
jgi:hypothetical protein